MSFPDPGPLLTLVAQAAPEGPVTEFVAGAAVEAAANARRFRFLIGAYTAVWTILALYLLTLSVRLNRLSQQVRRLKERPR
ncbi:MAG: CcmD family protein [Candidatus Polarisedimenticolia bacterium]